MADTQIWRTGALGDTTNFAALGSSNTTSSTPFCNSTSKPSASASVSSACRVCCSTSSLLTRNSCSERVDMAFREMLGPRLSHVGGIGDIGAARAGVHAGLRHFERELVDLAVELLGLEAESVLAVQLQRDAGKRRTEVVCF